MQSVVDLRSGLGKCKSISFLRGKKCLLKNCAEVCKQLLLYCAVNYEQFPNTKNSIRNTTIS